MIARDDCVSPIPRSTRRTFLKTAAACAAAAAVPAVVPASVFGAAAPSNRIGVGVIGNGNQSTIDLPAFLGHDDAQVLAVCDVNEASGNYKSPQQVLGRKVAQEKVEAFYAAKTGAGRYRGCAAYVDFRDVLARKDIDAVAIIVPDHWHAVMTVAAAAAGKDIYCEKPLSLCIAEGQAMVEAVRQYKRVLQTGSHYRSSPSNVHGCELVRNGRLGKLERIVASIPENNAVSPGPGWKPMPVPEGFDYERWLGPAPSAPYHVDRCLYRFRFILDYSGGQVTNFGAHTIDIGQFGNGTDETGPVEIESVAVEWPPKGSLFTTALKSHFRARYANGVELIVKTQEPGFRTRFEGTEGWLEYGYGGIVTGPASLAKSQIGPDEIHLPRSVADRTQESAKFHIPDHVRNFLDCIKSRQDPVARVERGHRTASICHLGNIAMMLGRKLKWDPVKEQFPGDDEANAMLRRPMRAPWTLPAAG